MLEVALQQATSASKVNAKMRADILVLQMNFYAERRSENRSFAGSSQVTSDWTLCEGRGLPWSYAPPLSGRLHHALLMDKIKIKYSSVS